MYLVALSNVQCLQMLASLTKKPNPCSSDIKTAKNFKNSEAAEKEKRKKKVNVVSTSEHVQIPSQSQILTFSVHIKVDGKNYRYTLELDIGSHVNCTLKKRSVWKKTGLFLYGRSSIFCLVSVFFCSLFLFG